MVLKFSFPRIFALAAKKEGRVIEYGNFVNGQWIWDVELRRGVFDWEKEQWLSFCRLINEYQVCPNLPDKLKEGRVIVPCK